LLRWPLQVAPTEVQVEVIKRKIDDSWRAMFMTDLAASIRVRELGASLSLAKFYAGLEAAA
jgi:hypothetical protein